MRKAVKYVVTHFEDIALTFFFAVMNVSLFLQISTRTLWHQLPWTEEVSRFCYIWILYLGMAFSKKLGLNINITFITNPLGAKAKKALHVFLEVLELVIYAFLLYWSIRFCDFAKMDLMPTLVQTMLWIYVSLPIGIFLTMIYTVRRIVVLLKPPKVGSEGDC